MLDMTGLEAAAKAGPEDLREQLLPPDKALEGMPAIELDAESAPKFLAGQKVSAPEGSPKGLARVYGADTEFLGVGQLSKDNCLAPKRVFHAGEKNS